MVLYEKSVKLLFRDMIKDISIQKGDVLAQEQLTSWFNKKCNQGGRLLSCSTDHQKGEKLALKKTARYLERSGRAET